MLIEPANKLISVSSKSRSAAKRYSVTCIRPVQKEGYSTGSMINAFGQAVGHGAAEEGTDTRAFAWSSEFGVVPDLGAVYGGSSFATDISDSGVIVGYTTTRSGSLRAFLLGQGLMYDLGLLTPLEYDESFSVASAVNSSGHVAGYSTNKNNSLHAFYWKHEDGMLDLGSLGTARSYAYGINCNDIVVGWSEVESAAGYRAFSWSQASGMAELPGKPQASSVAYAINDSNVICGATATGSLTSLIQAVIWSDNGLIELGSLRGLPFSSASSLNDAGLVVGWSYPMPQCELHQGRAMIWDQFKGCQDLNDLVTRNSGWLLHKATGVNNDGDIVGTGTFEGRQQAFMLTPEDYAINVKRLLDLQELSLITNQKNGIVYRTIMIRNSSHKKIKGPIQLVFRGLSRQITLIQSRGDLDGHPFRTVNTDHMSPGSQMSTTVHFSNPAGVPIEYNLDCYAGSF